MPANETAINQRLRLAREFTGLSRVAVAKTLGIPPLKLFDVERAKTLLRFELADAFCRLWDFNQRWLATGDPPMRSFVELPPKILAQLNRRMIFSEAYRNLLRGHVDRESDAKMARTEKENLAVMRRPLGAPEKKYVTDYCIRMVSHDIPKLPPSLYWAYLDTLIKALTVFYRTHEEEIDSFHKKTPLKKSPK
jgi:hypothetical protein